MRMAFKHVYRRLLGVFVTTAKESHGTNSAARATSGRLTTEVIQT
jgi:hypothetical protein